MRRLALPALVTFASFAGALRAQKPAKPVELPADWAQRDLEGKWVAYRAAVRGEAPPHVLAAAWCKVLGAAKELELLEWIAMFDGWQNAGPVLEAADAPQLLRAAAWNYGNFDSHGKDAAKNALLTRAARVRGWLLAFPDGARGAMAEIASQLAARNVEPQRDPDDLPPLDPMQVLVPWLDAPANVEEFGERTAAAPKVRYVHQVVRALGGVLVHGDSDDLVVTKVVALTRHGNATVRYHAFDTLSKLPSGSVPFAALAKIVDDAQAEPERRRLATLALSFSSHPSVVDALVRIALDAEHPGRDTALTRIAEVGDPVVAAPLQDTSFVVSTSRTKAVSMSLARLAGRRAQFEFQKGPGLRALLQRAAWLRVANDPRAADVWIATRALVVENPLNAADGLVALQQQAAPPSPFRGDEAAKVEKELQRLAAELLAALRAGK